MTNVALTKRLDCSPRRFILGMFEEHTFSDVTVCAKSFLTKSDWESVLVPDNIEVPLMTKSPDSLTDAQLTIVRALAETVT